MSIKKEINKIAINLKLFYNHLLGYTLIYPPQGMGDILILALGMEEYKKINNNPKVAFIVHKKHFVNLCRIFSENIDKIIFINKTPKKMPKYVINVSDRTYGVQAHFDRFES